MKRRKFLQGVASTPVVSVPSIVFAEDTKPDHIHISDIKIDLRIQEHCDLFYSLFEAETLLVDHFIITSDKGIMIPNGATVTFNAGVFEVVRPKDIDGVLGQSMDLVGMNSKMVLTL